MARKQLLQPAIVLHTNPYGESDEIVTLLSKDFGKIAALAKGVRRSKKRFMGGIDLFDCGVFDLSSPASGDGLYFISSLSKREVWQNLRKDILKFSIGSLFLEITNGFAAEGDREGGALFKPLYLSLRALDHAEKKAGSQAICVYYMLVLLEISGFNPMDDHTIEVSAETFEWWKEMKAMKKPIVPHEEPIISQSMSFLMGYSESILGRGLKTRAGNSLF